ncbi:MAG TPA: hypothetical protein VFQ37_06120 [Mycobacterium sp.]|nr:hypothetical protein [Mycobacterium sp.]
MSGVHPDLGELGPELRKLAQAILDGIDPAVRAAAMLAPADGPGKCQQVWCPVCALAALVTGEEHPLLTVIAEHSVALFAVIRAAVNDNPDGGCPTPPSAGPPGGGADSTGPATVQSGYQHIPVTVEE